MLDSSSFPRLGWVAMATMIATLTGCAGSQRTAEDILRSTSWGLVGVQLDRSRLANRGVLPTFDPPVSGTRFVAPTMSGRLTVDTDGNAVCEVTAYEVPAVRSGTPRTFEYPMVRFTGIVENEGLRMRQTRRPPDLRLGQATMLHVLGLEQRGRVIVLQASTDDRLLPYVYRFRRTSSTSNRVLAPTL